MKPRTIVVTDPVEIAALTARKYRTEWPHWELHGGGVLAKSDELKAWRAAQAPGKDCELSR